MSETRTTEILENVFNETYNTLDILASDPNNRTGDIHLLTELNSVTLAVTTVVGEYTCTLEAGHSVVVGDYLTISEGTIYTQARVTAVNTNDITLAVPFFYAFTAAATAFRKSAKIETANGSSTAVSFAVGPPAGQQWDVYGMTFVARDATDMDDAKFVGATALANGCLVAKVNTIVETRLNITSNSDMRLTGDLEYSSKAPSGEYGLQYFKNFRDRNGAAIRLDGDHSETIAFIVQDDLTVLTYARAMVHGHIVED